MAGPRSLDPIQNHLALVMEEVQRLRELKEPAESSLDAGMVAKEIDIAISHLVDGGGVEHALITLRDIRSNLGEPRRYVSQWYHDQDRERKAALQRRCEIYAAGLNEIRLYEGEYGLGYEGPKRVAQQTWDRANAEEGDTSA